MTVNLESMPALFYEVGQKATDPVTKALAGRCSLLSGIVQKMAEHIARLEEQLTKVEQLATGKKVEDTKPAEPAPEVDEEGVHVEGINPEAMADLDAEAIAMASRMNGTPTELEQAAMQEGTAP